MKLRKESEAILDVFRRKGLSFDGFVKFWDFGDAIVWESGYVKDEPVRLALSELLETGLVTEMLAGLSLTRKGAKYLSSVSSVLVGAAGEHYVMYKLARAGILVGQPPQGVANVDLLILDESANVLTNLQVKTRTKGADGGWHLKAKHENLRSGRLWYVFVDMEPDSPVCLIIPSDVVADAVKISHATWLSTPGKNGQPHRDTDMRRIRPTYPFEVQGFPPGWMDKYREAWHLLAG
jgi:hypothetical protein